VLPNSELRKLSVLLITLYQNHRSKSAPFRATGISRRRAGLRVRKRCGLTRGGAYLGLGKKVWRHRPSSRRCRRPGWGAFGRKLLRGAFAARGASGDVPNAAAGGSLCPGARPFGPAADARLVRVTRAVETCLRDGPAPTRDARPALAPILSGISRRCGSGPRWRGPRELRRAVGITLGGS
jgi:hypothetical protein